MTKNKKVKKIIFFIIILIFVFILYNNLIKQKTKVSLLESYNLENNTYSKANVTYIIDGDTFDINPNERIRLICIDSPEIGEFYYEEAKDYLYNLVNNKEVLLVKDISEIDKFDRSLRYVFVDNLFVNYELVANGYAKVYKVWPDLYKCDLFEEAQEKAKLNKLGIWQD
jgi:micrococcal nuclease